MSDPVEFVDMLELLGYKTDWRGKIYGKEESNKEAAGSTSKGSGEITEKAEIGRKDNNSGHLWNFRLDRRDITSISNISIFGNNGNTFYN